MKNFILALLILFGLSRIGLANVITMDGTMSLAWEYNLNTNSFVPLSLPAMNIRVVIDDDSPRLGIWNYTFFNGVEIDSPLFGLLGYDTSSWTELDSTVEASNEPSWNSTWLTLVEDVAGAGGGDERWMEFNSGPVMADPSNFTSADFEATLFSQATVGGSWGFRDDGNGLQNMLSGTIDSITVADTTSTPEPTTTILFGVGLLVFSLKHAKRRKALKSAFIESGRRDHRVVVANSLLSTVRPPWKLHYYAPSGTPVSLSAQYQDDSPNGWLEAKIFVDGQLIQSARSSGNETASVSGTVR